MTETARRAELTNEAVSKLIKVLTDAGYDVSRTKDFQTITFEVGDVKVGDKDYTAFGSLKFTLHKEDFDLADAENEYEERVKALEEKKAEAAKKKAEAEKKKAERESKKKKSS